MKKLLFGAILLFSSLCFSQALEPSTYYKVEVNTDAGKYWAHFYVKYDGQVRQINYEKNTYLTFNNYNTISNKTTTTYTWQNAGGVWSENQTWVFTKDIKSGNIYVMRYRVVQNEGEIPWSAEGVGIVETYHVN